MKTIYLFLAASLLLGAKVAAAPLTPDEALKRAGISQVRSGFRSGDPALIKTVALETGDPALYLFTLNEGEGAILLSADDAAPPLLGHSITDDISGGELSPQFEWWLDQYARQIEYLREMNVPSRSSVSITSSEVVAPMIRTTWNQSAPFNDDCPTVNGRHCPSGCVATAMAQIMKHWNYPERGTGTGAVTLPETGERETLNFKLQKFDWGNMLSSYSGNYTVEEGAAVAYLMKACGYSVEMNYTLRGSGAVSMNAAYALMNNFGYNKNLQYYTRDYCNATEWNDIIYKELLSGRPVLYAGQSTSVGHAFVCDGYDGEGYFHFNWGWGGMSDGYFLLDALNPGSVGTGGGEGGGYNFKQDIIVGIQPEKTEPFREVIGQTAGLSASATDRKVTLRLNATQGLNGWYNFGVHACNLNIGGKIESIDDGSFSPLYVVMGSSKLTAPVVKSNGSGGATVSYSGWSDKISGNIPDDLPDGKYRMTVCTQDRDLAESAWIPVGVVNDAYNYVIFSKSGTNLEFSDPGVAGMTLVDAVLTTDLYYGCATRLCLTLANNSAKELTQSFYPLLSSSGRNVMGGEGVTVTLQPGESKDVTFTTVFELLSGASAPSSRQIFDLQFYQPASGAIYDWSKQVTMNINQAKLTIEATEFSMPGLGVVEEEVPSGTVEKVYQVHDKYVIPFSCELHNSKGFFGYPVYVLVYPAEGGEYVAATSLSPLLTLAAGESGVMSGLLDFADGEEGYYFAVPSLLVNNYQWKEIEGSDRLWFRITSGDASVREIYGDLNGGAKPEILYDSTRKVATITSSAAITSVLVCTLDGKPVNLKIISRSDSSAKIDLSNLQSGVYSMEIDLSNLQSGVYIVKCLDATGRSATLKIAR